MGEERYLRENGERTVILSGRPHHPLGPLAKTEELTPDGLRSKKPESEHNAESNVCVTRLSQELALMHAEV